MSIRRTETTPQITPDDLQFTYKGRSFGLEITEYEGFNIMTLMEKDSNGIWLLPNASIPANLAWSLDWISDENIMANGGPKMWITKVFLPWFNAILAAIFKPVTVTTPTGGTVPAPVRPIDQVDILLKNMITIVPQSDGTIKAVLNNV